MTKLQKRAQVKARRFHQTVARLVKTKFLLEGPTVETNPWLENVKKLTTKELQYILTNKKRFMIDYALIEKELSNRLAEKHLLT